MTDNNGDGKMKLTCPRCQQVWSIKMPPPEIANNYYTSAVLVAHRDLVRCPNNTCRLAFVLVIKGVQVAMGAEPVDDTMAATIEGTSIIKPESALKLI
jgi:phage FluMu protein Com